MTSLITLKRANTAFSRPSPALALGASVDRLRTGLGYAPGYFGFFRGFGLFTVSMASPCSHPKRLPPAVGQLLDDP
jgi:hypothetical protein